MTIRVEIIDLGINNIGSVKNAFDRLEKVEAFVISKPSDSRDPGLLVLPGNGTFTAGMARLNQSGFNEFVLDRHQDQKPILGICLGMQLLFESSEEGPGVRGLGVIKNDLTLLDSSGPIPHVGWEDAFWSQQRPFGLAQETARSYYFMHSYAAQYVDDMNVLARTRRGDGEFVSAIQLQQTVAVQFHPEKSSKNGAAFLESIRLWVNG